MVLKKVFLILLICWTVIDKTYAQSDDCVPNSVQTLHIFPNATLAWTVDIAETCEITLFEVDIEGDNGDVYQFKVIDTHVDVSYLDICEEWKFTVSPNSNGILGYSRTLTDFIPLPSDADLSLSYFNVSSLGGREVLIEWDLTTPTEKDCTLQYRLSVADEDLGIAQDVYVRGKSLHLSFLSPCVSYQLGLRAVSRTLPTMEGPQRLIEFEIAAKPQVVPKLASLDIGATSINMTWNLEGGTNRCPLKDLYVDAGTYFNITVPLPNSIDPEPVEVQLKSLQSNSMYYFRVYVENSGGTSPAFALAAQTLELAPN